MVIFHQQRRIDRATNFLVAVQRELRNLASKQGRSMPVWSLDWLTTEYSSVIQENMGVFSSVDRPDIFFISNSLWNTDGRLCFDFPNIEDSAHIITLSFSLTGLKVQRYKSPSLLLMSTFKAVEYLNTVSKDFFDYEHIHETLLYLKIQNYELAKLIHTIYIKGDI